MFPKPWNPDWVWEGTGEGGAWKAMLGPSGKLKKFGAIPNL